MTQVGAPAVGEVLADRYRLEEHINDDSTGRQVWRGIDVILRRPVTVVLRYPGGAAAEEMLAAAVAASRVVHPHIVGVYDAVDEGARAYVVREWVDGRSLREAVRDTPLEPERATSIAHALADALAAVHGTGVAHGNVHPGTVLIGNEHRVVLADARADGHASADGDVRALGAVLYCALTGHWPREVSGPAGLPDAPRVDGRIASPRQVRSGVPNYLDALTMDLLDPALPPPSAAELSAELGRLDVDPDDISGALDLVSTEPHESQRPVWKKISVGVGALLAIALAGLLLGTRWLPATNQNGFPSASPNAGNSQGAGEPAPIKPTSVRIVDPPRGDRTEVRNQQNVLDGDQSTEWSTDQYNSAAFGGLKPGMGILLDLGSAREVQNVEIEFDQPGCTVQLRGGTEDPAAGGSGDSDSDNQIATSYRTISAPRVNAPPRAVLAAGGARTRYLLIWITVLPSVEGKFQVGVQDITVTGR